VAEPSIVGPNLPEVLIAIATVLRLASRIACVIVVVSFAIFALEQTSEASSHQQNEVTGTATGSAAPKSAKHTSSKSTVHRVIDEAASTLTSPFSGITAGSTSQWAIRGVGLVMTLLVYGIGVGYLARTLRIRV
jgi:hypothetical protein